ncbi:MAG TPA: hypothetical protein VIE63_06440, partial [Ramlibacter sp.]
VRSTPHGPVMEVLAASSAWAICEWFDKGLRQANLFEVAELQQVAVQQAQQPQPPGDDPPAKG